MKKLHKTIIAVTFATILALATLPVLANTDLSIHELENFIMRQVRDSSQSRALWQVSVSMDDGHFVGGAGAIWDIDNAVYNNPGNFAVVTNHGFTVIAGATVVIDDVTHVVSTYYAHQLANHILDFLQGRTVPANSYVMFPSSLADVQALQNGIVYFGRPTCPHCVHFASALHELATAGSARVYYVNTDYWRGHAQIAGLFNRFDVTIVPTLIHVLDGQITHLYIPDNSWRAVFADSAMRFAIGSNTFTLHGLPQVGDTAPFIDAANDRTMIPLRFVAEGLGATVRLENNTVHITRDGQEIIMTIGEALPGGMGAPVLIGGRTFVPARYVSEVLGATVRWDATLQAVYVYR